MTQTVELSPFFERAETSREGFPAEGFVAGLREPNGAAIGVEITLPAELVEQTVLIGSRLSLGLAPDGRFRGTRRRDAAGGERSRWVTRSDARVVGGQLSRPGAVGRRGQRRWRLDGAAGPTRSRIGPIGRDARAPQARIEATP
jgi:hypothetical protein